MTAQEIQALIDAKIAGQGSAVDVGGALPQILSGILEIAQSGAQKTIVKVEQTSDSTISTEEALSYIKINGGTATFDSLMELELSKTIIEYNGFMLSPNALLKDQSSERVFIACDYIEIGGMGGIDAGLSVIIDIYSGGMENRVYSIEI